MASSAPSDRETRIRAAVDELAAAILAAVEPAGPAVGAPDRLLSVEAAAEALSLGRSVTYRLITSGRLRSVRVGGRRLVPGSAVAEFIDGASGR